MIKRLSLILLLATLVLGAAAQVIEENVELIVNSSDPVSVGRENDDIRISLRANKYGNNTELSALMENNSEDYCLLLFGRSVPEKDLKRQKIRFDKKRYGKTGRNIVTCDGIEETILEIGKCEKGRLEVNDISGDYYKLNIVIYLAKQKKRKRIIMAKRQIVLNVSIKEAEKRDDNYDEIRNRCDKLIEEINMVTICPGKNGKHFGLSIEEQKAPYEEKKREIKDEIERIKKKYGWRDNDKEYERYKELISSLDVIKYSEKLCPKCIPDTIHVCDYCKKYTPKSILDELHNIYLNLDKRKISKDEAKRLARPLYEHVTRYCPVLKQRMLRESRIKDNIEIYYESIIKY